MESWLSLDAFVLGSTLY